MPSHARLTMAAVFQDPMGLGPVVTVSKNVYLESRRRMVMTKHRQSQRRYWAPRTYIQSKRDGWCARSALTWCCAVGARSAASTANELVGA